MGLNSYGGVFKSELQPLVNKPLTVKIVYRGPEKGEQCIHIGKLVGLWNLLKINNLQKRIFSNKTPYRTKPNQINVY